MWKRLSMLWAVVKGDAKLLWYALQHPQSPPWLKLGAAGIALYLFSPIDLIPDVLPVIGVMDDLVIVPLAIRFLYQQLPQWLRDEVEARAAGRRGPGGPGGSGAGKGSSKRRPPLVDVVDAKH